MHLEILKQDGICCWKAVRHFHGGWRGGVAPVAMCLKAIGHCSRFYLAKFMIIQIIALLDIFCDLWKSKFEIYPQNFFAYRILSNCAAFTKNSYYYHFKWIFGELSNFLARGMWEGVFRLLTNSYSETEKTIIVNLFS